MSNSKEYYTRMYAAVRAANGEELNQIQRIYSQAEKAAWAKFDEVRNTKYTGKGSRAVKDAAISEAKAILDRELSLAEDAYMEAHAIWSAKK